jgi:hypothetical protein
MRVTNEKELQEYLNKTGWQSFEKLVAAIFEENGYETIVGKVITHEKRMQIDVIAQKYEKKVVIECKKWNANTPARIRAEVEKQRERMALLDADEGIIVTLRDYGEKEIKSIRIVPLAKLNNYLNLE